MSSTAIRQAVEAGDFATAKRMLGRDYTILGTVEEGKHLGRSLGFPTANLSAHSEQFPPNGVYVAEGMLSGKTVRGVVNLGVRPTIGDGSPQRVLEFHLFDVDRDLYGEDVELRFLHYLRPERKFESLAALREQIARDVSAGAQDLRRERPASLYLTSLSRLGERGARGHRRRDQRGADGDETYEDQRHRGEAIGGDDKEATAIETPGR